MEMTASVRGTPLRRAAVLVAAIALVVGSVACGTISVQEEQELGRAVQSQVRQQLTLMRDPVTVNYIRKLGADLVQHSREAPFEFRFYVVEDEELNAFAVPGGAIYVNTGLIQAVDNVNELAGVIAHEIGHVTARHTAQLYKRQRNTGAAANVASVLNAGQMATGVAAHAYINTYTQEYEREADRLGVETLVNAGYDPNGMITMFETLKRESARSGIPLPQFLSSHPETDERIGITRSEIARYGARPAPKSSDGGRLEIIQERIRLLAGVDRDPAPDDE
jgi:predicted Zn-dependent protease